MFKELLELPANFQNVIVKELASDEEIKWLGISQPRKYIAKLLPWLVTGIVWLAIALPVYINSRLYVPFDFDNLFNSDNLAPLIIFLIAVVIVLLPIAELKAELGKVYLVSNKRAIIFARACDNCASFRINSFYPESLENIEINEHRNGSGDLILGKVTIYDEIKYYEEKLGFYQISEPKKVLGILEELQHSSLNPLQRQERIKSIDISELPTRLQSEVMTEIDESEKVIWLGRRETNLKSKYIESWFNSLMGVFIELFLLLALVKYEKQLRIMLTMGFNEVVMGLGAILMVLIFMGFVAVMILLRPMHRYLEEKNTAYVLTNLRAIIFEGVENGDATKTYSYLGSDLSTLHCFDNGDGTADVVMSLRKRNGNEKSCPNIVNQGFVKIKNARAVEQLVRDTFKRLT